MCFLDISCNFLKKNYSVNMSFKEHKNIEQKSSEKHCLFKKLWYVSSLSLNLKHI